MFLLFSTTFLELSAFLIIVYLIFTFWKKMELKIVLNKNILYSKI